MLMIEMKLSISESKNLLSSVDFIAILYGLKARKILKTLIP